MVHTGEKKEPLIKKKKKTTVLELDGGNGWEDPPVQFSSVAQSCLTLCDPMNRSMPGCLPST